MSGTQLNDLLMWAGIVVAAVAGAVGWIFSGVANSRAKNANQLAQASNDIATNALARADEANRISEQANQLSEQANTLQSRAVAKETEDWFVKWEPKWDEVQGFLVLTNKGSHMARQVSVTVTDGHDLHEAYLGNTDVPKGEKIMIALEKIRELRVAHEAEIARKKAARRITEWPVVYAAFKAKIDVRVGWKTGEGFPAHDDFELEVR